MNGSESYSAAAQAAGVLKGSEGSKHTSHLQSLPSRPAYKQHCLTSNTGIQVQRAIMVKDPGTQGSLQQCMGEGS